MEIGVFIFGFFRKVFGSIFNMTRPTLNDPAEYALIKSVYFKDNGPFNEDLDPAERLDRMEKNASMAHANLDLKINELTKKIDFINGRMKYIYGFVAGIGLVIPFLWEWIKVKILHL